MTVGVLAAFPAREVIVSTLGILYAADEEALHDRIQAQPAYTLPVALAVMVFFAFCLQCGSTVAVMAREAGWRWATFAFVYMTGLAWVGAVAVYQVGTAFA
jgi:ferrous iron transport protein B